jgi:hypothetical protein
MTEAKDPREVVWAACDALDQAGQMTRAMLATSEGWKEVPESHAKVKAALEQPPANITSHPPKPDRAASKEK